eukprot:TRINITY_DN3257_c0_g1::TRINITY_DN3257_c0_g1_i1::g.29715::m.29715 TRINITY_DN3257_c0_g1::TRINITY_DN3257_c0_g1_i1::g.29715  ORF type:complete len:409 (+),score=38.34,sp/A4IIC5/S39A3_XENTR/34.04/9e-21,Zip/PF02535.17/4.1e-55,DUF204/PF02659.10/1.5e+04,DUF204/PF02659.10/0.095,SdpI/PF13630.1/1.1e+02,SdpI/PF13630.1/0.26,SdpI/PF13630.1/9.5e+03,SdpI/PF13630.1/3.8e+03 TRINITY_DN3257_c0_g1_i1:175-1401(+)
MSLTLSWFKIILGFCLFLLAFLSGFYPYYHTRRTTSSSHTFLNLANLLSGGIFLGGGLLHLLPEAAISLECYPTCDTRVPLAYILCAVGFFIILIIEETALGYQARLITEDVVEIQHVPEPAFDSAQLDEEDEVGPSRYHNRLECVRTVLSTMSPRISLAADATDPSNPRSRHLSLDEGLHAVNGSIRPPLPKSNSFPSQIYRYEHTDGEIVGFDAIERQALLDYSSGNLSSHSHKSKSSHDDDGHGHGHGVVTADTYGVVAYVLIFALSFHSLFEGIALGTQRTYNSTLTIFLAIAGHTPLAAFALSIGLVKAKAKLREIARMLFLFAIFTPLGILVGVVLVLSLDNDREIEVTSGVFNALSSGTFLFIALAEIIPRELAQPGSRVAKISSCILGFTVMAILKISLE